MDSKALISLLNNPDSLDATKVESLRSIIRDFPYFQAPKALLLKVLKQEGSYEYNTELRKTAAYTTDRQVLFEYITSKQFVDSPTSMEHSESEKAVLNLSDHSNAIETITVHQSEVVKALPRIPMDEVVTMKSHEADSVLDPELFTHKVTEDSNVEITPAIKSSTKGVGDITPPNSETNTEALEDSETQTKPVTFRKDELHSFNEWLQLTSLKPLSRKLDQETIEKKERKEHATVQVERTTVENEVSTQTKNVDTDGISLDKKEGSSSAISSEKEKKFELIDNFLASNPKIGHVSKGAPEVSMLQNKNEVSPSLMTETLAKVYVEQKNYKKAIQAYNILILKNPEKSGFFADQIRAIKKLQHNN